MALALGSRISEITDGTVKMSYFWWRALRSWCLIITLESMTRIGLCVGISVGVSIVGCSSFAEIFLLRFID